MDKNIILSVRNINKSFPGTQALTDVFFELKKGEVHALVGENGAGKSTLVNIVSGVLQPESGEIFYKGERTVFKTPSEAQMAGIGFVHQEISLCQHVSVAENIFMGRAPKNRLGMIAFRQLNRKAKDILDLFKDCDVPKSRQIVKELTIAQQQLVEIARAISLDCQVLIMDEPTSSLTDSETTTLFAIIKDLSSRGISIIYISHRLSEIFNICERVTVLKDGKNVDVVNIADTTKEELVNKMVGREITTFYPEKNTGSSEESLLEVKNFSRKGVFNDISFKLFKGEVLGFAGLVGSGRTEVVRAICAIDKKDSGELFLNGEKLEINNYEKAIKNGICYLSEDRKLDGLFLNLSVSANIVVSSLDYLSKKILVGWTDHSKEKMLTDQYVKKMDIKISRIGQKVNSLSGGNQQKVMLAKWLSVEPKVLLLDEPTRGIDVRTKAEIHKILRVLASQGIGIVIVSSELPEIIGMCDRVAVMHEGIITGMVSGKDVNEEKIISYASGIGQTATCNA